MTLVFWFWLFFVLWVLGGAYYTYKSAPNAGFVAYGPNILLLVMLFIIGLKLFGSPIR